MGGSSLDITFLRKISENMKCFLGLSKIYFILYLCVLRSDFATTGGDDSEHICA